MMWKELWRKSADILRQAWTTIIKQIGDVGDLYLAEVLDDVIKGAANIPAQWARGRQSNTHQKAQVGERKLTNIQTDSNFGTGVQNLRGNK